MGFKYSYSSEDLINAIRTIKSIRHDACDIKSDGFTAWGAKQDLYRLKWILDQAFKDCPHFSSIENDWLKEQEKQKVWSILNEKTDH